MRYSWIWLFLLGGCFAQAPPVCPSNEVLKLPNDGPAASPRACVNTSAPVTKNNVTVSTQAELMANLKCDTTVSLKAGNYDLSGQSGPTCTAGHGWTLKSAGQVTPAGTRDNPSWHGVSSLPGRPAFSNPFLGKVKPASVQITIAKKAFVLGNFNRLGPGLEITVPEVGGQGRYSVVLDARGCSHCVILRNWIHGNAKDEIAHGILANGADHFAAVGNYFSDFHCLAGIGNCTDAQAIDAGCGASGAAFLIDNNFIEASTEGLLFGGCGATSTASDVIISRNHFFKPLFWMKTDPNYTGPLFTVKNSLEFKNCIRCLVQGNILENSWGGFTQNGYSLLLTPKNQAGHAPSATVSDIIVRYNKLVGGAGIQFAAAKDDPPLSPSSLGTTAASIHDNLILIDNAKYTASAGLGMQLTLQDNKASFTGISIYHNSFAGITQSALMLGTVKAGTLDFENNILEAGKYDATAAASTPTVCSYNGNTKPAQMLTNCWTSVTFSGNYVVGGNANWPAGTSVPTLSPYVSESAGDYHSTISGLGADIDLLNKYIAGVE